MMDKGTRAADIRINGDMVDGLFVTADVVRMVDKNGNPYWALTLADSTGSVGAKIWSRAGQLSPETLESRAFVRVRGSVNVFRDQLQVRVDSLQVLDQKAQEALNLDDFLPPSPYDGPRAFAELMAIVEREVAGTPWQRLVDAFFDEKGRKDFVNSSAARSMHHAGRGGLAVHVLEICRICLSLADLFPDLDRPTLVCGALFHDIGKLEEMHTDPFEVTYTRPGNLIGHLVLGVARLEGLCEKAGLPVELKEHLFHLILSHHGRIDYGAVKEPMSMEAVVLAEADMLSARLNTIRNLVQDVEPGTFAQGTRSSWFRGFSTKAFAGQVQQATLEQDEEPAVSSEVPLLSKHEEPAVSSESPSRSEHVESAAPSADFRVIPVVPVRTSGVLSGDEPDEGGAFKALPSDKFLQDPPPYEPGYLESLEKGDYPDWPDEYMSPQKSEAFRATTKKAPSQRRKKESDTAPAAGGDMGVRLSATTRKRSTTGTSKEPGAKEEQPALVPGSLVNNQGGHPRTAS